MKKPRAKTCPDKTFQAKIPEVKLKMQVHVSGSS